MLKIETGDLLIVENTGWISKIISFVTKSRHTHAGVFCYLWGELYVIEAEMHGIQITKWSDSKYASGKHKEKGLILMKYKGEITYTEKEIASFMLPMCGTRPYDYKGLIDQLVYQISGKWIGRKKEKATKRFYCSEFASYVHNHFLGNIKNWWEISPAQLFDVPNYEKIKLC